MSAAVRAETFLHHIQLRSGSPRWLARFYEQALAMTAQEIGHGDWICDGPSRRVLFTSGGGCTRGFGAFGVRVADATGHHRACTRASCCWTAGCGTAWWGTCCLSPRCHPAMPVPCCPAECLATGSPPLLRTTAAADDMARLIHTRLGTPRARSARRSCKRRRRTRAVADRLGQSIKSLERHSVSLHRRSASR